MSKFDKALARQEKKILRQLAQLEEKLREQERKSRKANWFNGLLLLAVPLAVAFVPVFFPPAEAAPTQLCTASFDRAVHMWERDGVWMALPEDSEEEKYCQVNDRMVDAYDLEPGETVYLSPTP